MFRSRRCWFTGMSRGTVVPLNHVSPRAERQVYNVSKACDAQPDRINTSGDRRPRRTLLAEAAAYAMLARLKLSVHAVALCALCPPLYCPGATRPRQACSQSSYPHAFGLPAIVAGWACGPGVRLARHRRRRQALYATRGGRGVRYTCTIDIAHHVS